MTAKVTFEAMKVSSSGFGPKALYTVLVDGVKVGVVAQERVEVRRRHVRFPRSLSDPVVHYSRRSRPLLWVARGTGGAGMGASGPLGRKMVQVSRTSRRAAVEALLEGLGVSQ